MKPKKSHAKSRKTPLRQKSKGGKKIASRKRSKSGKNSARKNSSKPVKHDVLGKGKKSHPRKSGRKSVSKVKKIASRGRSKGTGKVLAKRGSVHVQKVRGKDHVKITFKGVEDIDQKIALIKEHGLKQIDAMDKAHGGKKAKMAIVVLGNKKGKQSAKVSDPSMSVNPTNVKAFVEGVAEKVKDDWETLQELQDYDERSYPGDDFDQLGPAEGGGEDSSDENFDPNTVSEVTIKLIY